MTSPVSKNSLINSLSASDRALLAHSLKPVPLPLKLGIERQNAAIEHIYFPESGVISIVAKSPGGHEIEAGIIGREGMTGIPVMMGDDRSPHQAYVQIAGAALRMSADDLRAAMRASPTLQQALLRFASTFAVQITQTALANGRAKIEERLARWLLMAQDRLGSDDVALTHDFLALMLGVRRPGVTIALHELEKKALIRSTRGAVKIVDRDGLVEASNGVYGLPEAEYKRLFPA